MANPSFLLSTQEIGKACEVLAKGGCIGIPTETVYGLAADAMNDKAVAHIFALKQRPQFNPLIVHVVDDKQAKQYVEWNVLCDQLTKTFWPGPLTLVRPRLKNCPISDLCSAGGKTLAIRSPKHPLARSLLEASNRPLAAPSANISGSISPTCSQHVLGAFEEDVYVLEGGASEVGLESTVLWVDEEWVSVMRPGSITTEMIDAEGIEVKERNDLDYLASPGQLQSHYAPSASVRLNAEYAEPEEVLLGFGKVDGTMNLSPKGDLEEAAANLFRYLRLLDERGVAQIAVATIPNVGIGCAINDRLQRAAAPRV